MTGVAINEEARGTLLAPEPVAPARARRPRLWWEALLIIWLAWAYDAISNLTPLRPVAPYSHAESVLRLEQLLHLDPELALNRWLAPHLTLGWWAGNYYDIAHFVVTFGMIGWLWWRRPELYRPLRTGLALINVLGFIIFWRYPMAPPRLTPGQHYVDVVATTHAYGSWHSGALASAANELAAMPSLHIAWAMWASLVFWRMFRRHRWAVLAWAYPVVTTVVVMATGNHYLADAVAGAATMILATLIADRLGSWFRNWWSWRPKKQQAPKQEAPEQDAPKEEALSR
jgi:hypothetical protein